MKRQFRPKAPKASTAYSRLWNIVSGPVADTFKMHPDYLTPKGQRSAANSVIKRVTGTVLGFAEQSAKGRRTPADNGNGDATPEPASLFIGDAGEGARKSPPPDPHCRIGKIRLKSRTRYRSPDAFTLTTKMLRAAVEKRAALKSVRA